MRSRRAEGVAAQQQEIKREHAQPGENVGEQDAVSQGRVVTTDSAAILPSSSQRPVAQPVRAQRERHDPDRERRLQRPAPARNASGRSP